MIIDLKNVTVYFEDGTLKTGAINHTGGYAADATSLVVDGFTGIVPVGARLSVDGDDRYQVVSTTETTGNTTGIVITPGLYASVLDNDVVIAYGVFVAIKVGDGQITWSEKKPREYKLDRGLIDEVRNGDQVPMDVSFTMAYTELTAADPDTDPPTPEDVLKQRGAAESWISVDTANPCSPYCINIRLDHLPPNCTAVDKERVILPKFYYEELQHDPKAGTITCTGKCNATEALVSRIAIA